MTNDIINLGTFANIRKDRWFKRTFGVKKRIHLLRRLLTEIIPEHDFAEVTLVKEEFINVNPDDYKSIRVDLSAIDSDGTRVIIEMQVAEQDNYYERIAFNSAFPIQEQKEIGSQENDFPTVYMVSLMDFSYHEDSDQVLFRGRFRWDDSHEAITDRVQLIFLELPNCKKALTKEAGFADNFCYVMHNIEKFDNIPSQLSDDKFFVDLFDSARIANFTAREKRLYKSDMLDEQSIAMHERFIERKAREGGRDERSLEIARNLIAMNYPIQDITKATGLSPVVVESLRQS
jgi:predicted transposase/invertase (TIGR01784 family)